MNKFYTQPDYAPDDFWPINSDRWYPEACRMLNYPEVVIGNDVKKVLRPDDVVLDVGCGFGLSSLYLAGISRRVIAMDKSSRALRWLESECKRLGVTNITTVQSSFPNEAPYCDVIIMLYVSGLIRSAQEARGILALTGREGFILADHSLPGDGFAADLYQRLGVERKPRICRNACYVLGLFDMLGAKTDCHMITHEFGQPVQNIDDAADFILWQLKLDPALRPQVCRMAGDYLTERNGQLYLENSRSGCLIHYVK